MSENELSRVIVNVCFNIHKTLGPGLLESVYEAAICHDLAKLGIPFTRQQVLPVIYDGVHLDLGFRTDVIVMNKVVIEIKSIETVAPVHRKILLTYLRLTTIKLGLLVNFSEELIKDGIHRVVNGL
ncbi:MAG: GxxExxY protein [Cyclobacteriaceae bacterium]|nr:GxxExxY protein [Cyclobacteriaceae bacterium]